MVLLIAFSNDLLIGTGELYIWQHLHLQLGNLILHSRSLILLFGLTEIVRWLRYEKKKKKNILLRDTGIWREGIYLFVKYLVPNLLNLCNLMTLHFVFQMFLYFYFAFYLNFLSSI